MKNYNSLEELQNDVLEVIKDERLTFQQQTFRLAKLAENSIEYPIEKDNDFYKYSESKELCDLEEGHAPYAPRYILPDYEKFLKEGSEFLRLGPATNLMEAVNNLLIIYRHVPSITKFPVFVGRLDKLLEPFVETINDENKTIIKYFLINLDRTINDSFCHANIGPDDSKVGNIILDLLNELQNVTPNMTLLYDPKITSDEFAEKAIKASLNSANPAFANFRRYKEDFKDIPFGIASCYNALPTTGGAFTLSRIKLNEIAKNSKSVEDFFDNELPRVINSLTNFMENKIEFLVEETPFFSSNFLVKEGLIKLDNFVGLFGLVGLHEAIEILGTYQNKELILGRDLKALLLGEDILKEVERHVESHTSNYSPVWNHKFLLHSQVGGPDDKYTSPGVRVQIGKEPELYDHLKIASRLQKYFPSGTGDHFPFDSTALKNPAAIVDIFKGSFDLDMRYISCYSNDSDLIRVTGYLIKKSDLKKFNEGSQISYDTIHGGKRSIEEKRVLERKVQHV